MQVKQFDDDHERQLKSVNSSLGFEEKTKALFEDDDLAAETYWRVYHKRVISSEQELMAAVLDEAIADYQRYLVGGGRRSMKRFAEVEGWLLRDDTQWIFSYVNCCDFLGIEPAYLRGGLLRWKQKKLSGLSTPLFTTTRRKVFKKPFRHAA